MSSIPSNLARISGNLVADTMLSNLRRTNTQLLDAQQQLSTGKRINRPSDDSSVIGSLTTLQRTLGQFEQQRINLGRAQATIDTTDQALADVSDLLLEAEGIASSQVGVGSTPQTRANQAAVIDAMVTSLLGIANRQVRGVYLFGGANADQQPFVDDQGGVRYIGPREDLQADLGLLNALGVNSNGADAFGALSQRVAGTVDLNPRLDADTRLDEMDGARNLGLTLGTITVDIDGSDVQVDLRGADRAQDIVERINNAIDSIDPTAGALSIGAHQFDLTASAGHTITISDIGTGITAADLGIDLGASGGVASGGDLNRHLTEQTSVAAFAGGLDLASGLKVTQGGQSKVISFAGATSVREMMNRVDAADIGVRLEINAAGDGLNLVNEVSGSKLSIGENAGGTTATDLGLRSFDTTTKLGELNFGRGVSTASGDDIRLHLHDGSDIDVDLSAAATIGDVIAAINAAGGGAVTASLAADGNGLALTDTTVGGDAFGVVNLGQSHAATDLGIRQDVGAAATIAGDDVAQVRTASVFTHLMMLRDGLLGDDEDLITEAGSMIHQDISQVASARAQMGVRARQVLQQSDRLEERAVQTRSLISDLQDADFNEVISRFTQLQQQLQAGQLAGQRMLSLSLLDFLR